MARDRLAEDQRVNVLLRCMLPLAPFVVNASLSDDHGSTHVSSLVCVDDLQISCMPPDMIPEAD